MEGKEIRKKGRIPMTISVDPFIRKELVKVKKIDPGRLSISGLIEFCTMYPYSLGDLIFALEVLKSTPERYKRLIMCFYRKDKYYEEAAKTIKEVLNRKGEYEFKFKDAIRYIKNREEGGNSLIEKKIQEIEDNVADLKTMMKMK